MSTNICNVGKQVWRGCLVLSDFIIYHKKKFQDTFLLELGCGVGLLGIVASYFCDYIYCTGTYLQYLLYLGDILAPI